MEAAQWAVQVGPWVVQWAVPVLWEDLAPWAAVDPAPWVFPVPWARVAKWDLVAILAK